MGKQTMCFAGIHNEAGRHRDARRMNSSALNRLAETYCWSSALLYLPTGEAMLACAFADLYIRNSVLRRDSQVMGNSKMLLS